MKRPTTLLSRVLLNEGLQTKLAVERDIREIEYRFEHEGMSFLTITLPSLDDALIQGLTQGFLTPSMFHGFKPCKRGGKLPAFMSGFFRNVFNEDGWLKDAPCIDSIRAIRQVTRIFKKVQLPCSSARVLRAFERYVSNDQSIEWSSDSPVGNDHVFHVVAGYLWSDLEDFAGELYCSPGVFGSGATAERRKFNERHSVRQWPRRGEENFPSSYHVVSNEGDSTSLAAIEFLEEDEEQPVRVVQVPKTLKTPRIISVEPSYMMLRQQSVAKVLMDLLESGLLGFRSIRFSNQMVNRQKACEGSVDGSLATIDLSDASDLVSLELVKKTFHSCPSFLQYLLDARSTRALMPDGSLIELKKYASQGSALCFPVEAMVFFTLVMSALVDHSGRRPSRKLLDRLAANVAIYGDDIIVPTETAEGVMKKLEDNGLRVNHEKSFTKGFFRESCGGDYYRGQDVTPAYVRQWSSTFDTREPSFVAACVSLSNQFYMKGLWHASQYLRDSLEAKGLRLSRTRYPVGCLTWASYVFDTRLKWDTSLGNYVTRGPVLYAPRRQDSVQDVRGGLILAFGPGYLSDRRTYLVRARYGLESKFGRKSDPSSNCSDKQRPEEILGVANERNGRWAGTSDACRRDLREYRESPELATTDSLGCTANAGSQLSIGEVSRVPRIRIEPGSWEESFLRTERRMEWLNPLLPRDLSTSVRPYALKLKHRLVPVPKTGLSW